MKRAVLHVGLEKTGTTFLQQVLYANRSPLKLAGICYPRTGLEYGHHFWIAKAFHFRYGAAPADLEREHATKVALKKELETTRCGTVLISSEHFDFNVTAENTKELVNFCSASEVILVLRNQIDYAQSLYIEHIKWGGLITFREFVSVLQQRGKLDFENRVALWTNTGAKVHVVDYDQYKRDLLSEFLNVCRLDVRLSVPPGLDGNVSPGIDFIELVRHVNFDLPEAGRRDSYLRLVERDDQSLNELRRRRQWPFPSDCLPLIAELDESNRRLARALDLRPDSFLGGSLIDKFRQLEDARPPNAGPLVHKFAQV